MKVCSQSAGAIRDGVSIVCGTNVFKWGLVEDGMVKPADKGIAGCYVDILCVFALTV